MTEKRQKLDQELKDSAVRIVEETGKSIPAARDQRKRSYPHPFGLSR